MKPDDELKEVLIDITRSQEYHDDTYCCPCCGRKIRGTRVLSCSSCNEIKDQEAFDLYY